MGPQIWHTGGVPSSDAGFERGAARHALGPQRARPAGRRADERGGDRRHRRRLRQRRGRRQGARLRHARDPWRARLPDRPVLLVRHQPAAATATAARRSPSARASPPRWSRRCARRSGRTIRSSCASASGSSRTTPRAWRRRPAEMEQWLGPLVDAGVDILHCSQRRFWEPEFPEIDGEHGLNFAGWAKKLTGAPTISVGSVGLSGDFFGAFQGQVSQASRPRRPGRAHGARRVRPDRGRPRAAVRSALGREGARRAPRRDRATSIRRRWRCWPDARWRSRIPR